MTVTVLASAVTPSFPLIPNYHLENNFPSTVWPPQSQKFFTSPDVLDCLQNKYISGKKKEPKPKLFGPDIFGWGGGPPCEWVGAKKFGMSLENREIKLFGRDISGFCRDLRMCPKSLRKKSSPLLAWNRQKRLKNGLWGLQKLPERVLKKYPCSDHFRGYF